jgi:hypothetical protein
MIDEWPPHTIEEVRPLPEYRSLHILCAERADFFDFFIDDTALW